MFNFFVWSIPTFVQIFKAASEQEAAESFLRMPVTSSPIRGEIPACFVQSAEGLDAPGIDGNVTGFWIDVFG